MASTNPGDALGKETSLGSSKQEQYYAWKLMADRMAIGADDRYSKEAKAILGANSQREALKFKILAKIIGPGFEESSAAYALLREVCDGKEDKLAQAEHLADRVFNEMKARKVLNEVIPAEGELTAAFTTPGTAGAGAGIAATLGSFFTPR
jgi:hypothetical protein